jgi:4-hydroxy-tetrahydrodipicolinate synthase
MPALNPHERKGKMRGLLSEIGRGVIPALPTPLTQNGNVDDQGLQKLVGYVVENGAHNLWVLGSSGEFPALSSQERRQVVDVAVNTVKSIPRRVPVLVGVGDNDVRNVIRYAEEAFAIGADACFTMLPFYFCLNSQEAIRYFREIATASPLPVILYDNPTTTKIKLSVAAYQELADCPNIIGLKESSGDFIRFQNLLVTLRGRTSWKFLQGDERLVGPSLLWGADGVVASLASIAPALFVNLYESARKGDSKSVFDLQKRVLSLAKLFELDGVATDGTFFAGVKAALQVLGISGRTVTKPFRALPEKKMVEVEEILRDCEARR